MKIIWSFLLVLSTVEVFAQALNTTLQDNWNDESLPLFAGLRYNDVWGYTADDGREYAILGSLAFTHFLDITDPTNVAEVDREPGKGNCVWRDFKTFGHYLYGVGEVCSSGLEIYDLSTLPDSVHRVYDSTEFFVNAHNVWIDTITGRLYAVGVSSGIRDVVVLDLNNDPTDPELVLNLSFPDQELQEVHDIHVINDTAFVSHGSSGLLGIYDFTALPNDPIPIAQIASNDNAYNHSSWISADGKRIVLADETGDAPVIFADISDITQPDKRDTIKSMLLGTTGSIPHNPFIVGDDFLVMAYYDDGIQIYNMSDLDDPFLAGYFDTDTITTSYTARGAWGAYPYFPSGTIIGSDIRYGLFVIRPNFPLSDCQSDIEVDGVYDNLWDIISSDSINSSALYHQSAQLMMTAPDQVMMSSDFQIDQGSELMIYIDDPCSLKLSTSSKDNLKSND